MPTGIANSVVMMPETFSKLESKLEVLCEVVHRIEEKVDKQNGSVARLHEWQIAHIEQSKERCKQIEGLIADQAAMTERLAPVLAALKYPRWLVLGFFLLLITAGYDVMSPVLSVLGLK